MATYFATISFLWQETLIMTATIDKFGRVLIPKKIREAGGYSPGTAFELLWDAIKGQLTLKPIFDHPEPVLVVDEFGIPSFDFGVDEVFDYDFNDAIKQDREERGAKNLGLD